MRYGPMGHINRLGTHKLELAQIFLKENRKENILTRKNREIRLTTNW